MKIVVLAGGSGTRLWPVSTKNRPKQFLNLYQKDSFLQQTLRRFDRANLLSDLIISTSEEQFDLVKQQVGAIHPQLQDQILQEPCNRSTAGSIAWSVKHMMENLGCTPEETFLVCPSDHFYQDEHELISYLKHASAVASEGKIVLFGKKPTSPETGYGYVKVKRSSSGSVFDVDQFVEKPNVEKAKQFLQEGNYLWNLGTFVFQIKHFIKELQEYTPEISKWFQGSYEQCRANYHLLPNTSIDYAIMEKSKEISLFLIHTLWSDIGSWDSIYDILDKDEHQNAKLGKVIDVDTKNCLLIGNEKLIATIGVEDLLIVETEDAIVISKRGESQKVKQIVEKLS